MARFTSTEIEDIIAKCEQKLSESYDVAKGDRVNYNGTEYEVGDLRSELRKDIQYWEGRLDKALSREGDGGNKTWFNRAEGWS